MCKSMQLLTGPWVRQTVLGEQSLRARAPIINVLVRSRILESSRRLSDIPPCKLGFVAADM